MKIRLATENDIPKINELLFQVLDVHRAIRPDIFKPNAKKYTDSELLEIIRDEKKPVFVAADDSGVVVGYAFCYFITHENDNILKNVKSLYIDDLCVDERCRGMHIGRALYEHARNFAITENCYNVTLNVWAGNENAQKFYGSLGLRMQKIHMEDIL